MSEKWEKERSPEYAPRLMTEGLSFAVRCARRVFAPQLDGGRERIVDLLTAADADVDFRWRGRRANPPTLREWDSNRKLRITVSKQLKRRWSEWGDETRA